MEDCESSNVLFGPLHFSPFLFFSEWNVNACAFLILSSTDLVLLLLFCSHSLQILSKILSVTMLYTWGIVKMLHWLHTRKRWENPNVLIWHAICPSQQPRSPAVVTLGSKNFCQLQIMQTFKTHSRHWFRLTATCLNVGNDNGMRGWKDVWKNAEHN